MIIIFLKMMNISNSNRADGIISQGTVVKVSCASGKIIVDMTLERDELCRVLQQCASEEEVPMRCMNLLWNPPIPLRVADMSHSPVPRAVPLLMVARAIVSALQEADYEAKMRLALQKKEERVSDSMLICMETQLCGICGGVQRVRLTVSIGLE